MKTFAMPDKRLLVIAITAVLMTACSTDAARPDGAANLRSRLTQLQSNPQLGGAAPLAMKEAEAAVIAAEKPQMDETVAVHLVFIADRKISLAQAQAESHVAVDQRKALSEQREAMRLQARTDEADSANMRAAVAHVEADTQRRDASAARDLASAAMLEAENQKRDADAARDATADAKGNAQELQKQIDLLQAKVTDRGLVLTLGDVLFSSGTANLNSGGSSNLNKLATFLNKYPTRTTLIEGHTDSIGAADYNQGLSQRRADAVKSYLMKQGIDSSRMTASGKGEDDPVGDNSSATGRQQNRRVEVVIENDSKVASTR